MVINENLLPGSNKVYSIKNKSTEVWGAVNFYINDLGLEHGKEYTISFDVLTLGEKSRGNVGFFVTNAKGNEDTFKETIKAYGRVSSTFTYDENKSDRIGLVPGPVGNAGDCEASFDKVKLEEGSESTIYILSKKDVKPDNQVIFKAGGYSKRCIHSKIGGGVC